MDMDFEIYMEDEVPDDYVDPRRRSDDDEGCPHCSNGCMDCLGMSWNDFI